MQQAVVSFYEKLAPNATYEDALDRFYEEIGEVDEAIAELSTVCSPTCECPSARAMREHLAKELADVVFTAFGVAIKANINLDQAFEIVAADNLMKVRTESGKVSKPEGYITPSLAPAVGL